MGRERRFFAQRKRASESFVVRREGCDAFDLVEERRGDNAPSRSGSRTHAEEGAELADPTWSCTSRSIRILRGGGSFGFPRKVDASASRNEERERKEEDANVRFKHLFLANHVPFHRSYHARAPLVLSPPKGGKARTRTRSDFRTMHAPLSSLSYDPLRRKSRENIGRWRTRCDA